MNQNLAKFARLTLDKPLHVRFIEYMPIGKIDDSLPPAINANPLTKTVTSSAFIPWSDHDVVPAVEIRSLLNDALKQEGIDPLVPLKQGALRKLQPRQPNMRLLIPQLPLSGGDQQAITRFQEQKGLLVLFLQYQTIFAQPVIACA